MSCDWVVQICMCLCKNGKRICRYQADRVLYQYRIGKYTLTLIIIIIKRKDTE